MAVKPGKQDTAGALLISRTTMADLRGRQSVRATFRLSAGCINAISVVATHLGIKQKTLFDHLVEDSSCLESLARSLRNNRPAASNRIQKTYVISRRTLACLEQAARDNNTARDMLVEVSVRRLLPLIDRERQRHAKRKQLLTRVQEHFQSGCRLLEKVGQELGKEDPLTLKLESVMAAYTNACNFMADYVEKGKIIETFDPSQMDS